MTDNYNCQSDKLIQIRKLERIKYTLGDCMGENSQNRLESLHIWAKA